MATGYDVNYDDSRFTQVEAEKQNAMSELEQTYDGMIDQSDGFYQAQIDASKEWAEKQGQLQQEQTDFAIEQIQQQKDQAKKDYTKEQGAAYKDWQKQSNQYGANAEAMAAQGMDKTGYSESAQVSMYNTYQNRVATARESYNKAVQDYDNAMTEARLQNNATLAEIAAEALEKQLELALSGFQYKNQLLLDKVDKKTTMDQMYYNRYQDVLAQINQENALAEEIRQYNEKMAEERRQYDESLAEEKRQYDESIAEEKRQFDLTAESNGIDINKGGDSGQASDDAILLSIQKLGYGDLTAEELAELIEKGEVILNEDGTVSKAPTEGNANSWNSANKYTSAKEVSHFFSNAMNGVKNVLKGGTPAATSKGLTDDEKKTYAEKKDEQEKEDLSIPYAQRKNY